MGISSLKLQKNVFVPEFILEWIALKLDQVDAFRQNIRAPPSSWLRLGTVRLGPVQLQMSRRQDVGEVRGGVSGFRLATDVCLDSIWEVRLRVRLI